MGAAVQRVRQALEDLGHTTRGGNVRFRAHCPVHESSPGSLTLCVSQGDRGAKLNCFAGCKTNDVRIALGLSWPDLFDFPRERAGQPFNVSRRSARPAGRRPVRPPDPYDELRRILHRTVDLAELRLHMQQAPMGPPLSADDRVALAEWGEDQDAYDHYWRTLAKWAALACDEDYVRRAYRDRLAGHATHEQIMVLHTRDEDLRNARRTAA